MRQHLEQSQSGGILQYPYRILRPVYEKTPIHTGVIDELPDKKLKDAYTICRQITRKHAKTFYLATRFLPYKKQRSIFAIYALCRYVDDLIDEAEDLLSSNKVDSDNSRELIDTFKESLLDAYNDNAGKNPILVAFAHTLKSYHIPIEFPFELMEGVCSDLHRNRFLTFQEVYDYSYKVAATVGLMTCEVFGYDNVEARKYAIDLGIAMQLTNILRDIGEDLARNRIYLPKEELDLFGVTEEDLFNHVSNDKFFSLMDLQIKRAREFYKNADIGIKMLHSDSRIPVLLARYNYSRILDMIEKNKYQVFKNRAYLNTTQKLSILPKVWLNSILG